MAGAGDKIDNINKKLAEQLELLSESKSISNSAVDTLKEALGIQERRSTAESEILQLSKKLNKAILNQEVGLTSVSGIQRQIKKNQKAINQGKLIEQGLEESLIGQLGKKVESAIGLTEHYNKVKKSIKEQTKALEAGAKIDINKLKGLKESEKLIANALDGAINQLSPLEKQLVAVKTQNKELDKQSKLRKEELAAEKQIQKQLGLAGGILKGINKIPILGDIFDANEAVEDMEDHLREGGNAVGALGAGFKNIGKQIFGGLTNPANLALSAFGFMVEALISVDKQTGELAKSMNMTYGEANNTRKELSSIANLSGDAALNTDNLQKTLTSVGSALGTNASLNKADLKTFTKLTEQAGFQADELMKIQKLSLAQGKSLKANTKEILGGAKEYARRNKIAVNEKTILKEVNNMSASLKLSLGGSGDAMAKAAVEAKSFGINLQQAENISQSLLNFEQSIEDELSAELLTGKDLNFEKARSLALSGDAAGAAKEILKQAQDLTEEQQKNPIIMGQMAKAAGMTREELAASMIESKALKSIGVESVEAAQEKYDKLRETMSAEEAAAALGDEALAKQFEQQSMQEEFNNSVQKLKDIFVTIVQEILPAFKLAMKPILFIVEAIGTGIGMFVKGLKDGNPLAIALAGIMAGMAIPLLISAVGAIMSTFAMIPLGIGIPLGIAAVAGMYSMATKAKSIKDGVIDPKGGIMMSGEKGSIQLDKDDSVIAGTDLFGGKKGGSSQQQQPQGGTDMTAVINAINALASRPINVQVGEEVIIKAAVGNDPKITGDEMGKNSYQLN